MTSSPTALTLPRDETPPPARTHPSPIAWLNAETAGTVLCLAGLLAGYAAERLFGAPGWARAGFVFAVLTGFFITGKDVLLSLKRRSIDVNLLMILAGGAAGALGHWDEAALLMFLFSLSTAMEKLAVGRTRRSLESLMSLKIDRVRVVEEGRTRMVPTAEIRPGRRIRVGHGERIPLDGRVAQGASSVDQSAMTGESMPAAVGEGSPVWAGTLNLEGELEIEVEAAESETKLARVIRLVEEARESRGESERRIAHVFGDRYAVGVIVFSAALAVLPPLFGMAWHASIYRALTVLVVASPCALVIATPAVVLSSISAAARAGILIKGGAPLEALARVRVAAFDKTGTLTYGRPRVRETRALNGASPGEVLRLAASAERELNHPLAHALVAAAREGGIELIEPSEVQVESGVGVRARIGGDRIYVGRLGDGHDFGAEQAGEVERVAREFEERGLTCFGVARGGTVIGLIAVADEPRAESAEIQQRLRALGIERSFMLTGDNRRVARAVAAHAGIDDFYAELMPEDKSRVLGEIARKHGCTVMIGDGVNDAPAMGSACVAVAMGGIGSDAALETADVVLMTDDLGRLPAAIALGRRAARVLKQNFAIAIGTMSVLVVLALFGFVPLPLAVVGHEGTTVLVMFNGLRLLRG